MAKRNKFDKKLVKIGELLMKKRQEMGPLYSSREKFITERSKEIFDYQDWISLRHLSNIELGYNWPSIEMLIKLAYALEVDPVDLFVDILTVYRTDDST
ncbi:MAG: helix-turn-helix transcriptional regulator [Bacillota bacterium]